MAITPITVILRQCLLNRISGAELIGVISEYHDKSTGRLIFKTLLDCNHGFVADGDPLIPLYTETLINTGKIKFSEILLVLAAKWNHLQKALGSSHFAELPASDVKMLQDSAMFMMTPAVINDTKDTQRILYVCSRWLSVLAQRFIQDSSPIMSPVMNNAVSTLGFILATMSASNGGMEIFSNVTEDAKDKTLRQIIASAIRNAIDVFLPAFSSMPNQLVERLGGLQKHINMIEHADQPDTLLSAQAAEMAAMQFQLSIVESQVLPSRSGTVVYLESLIHSRSTIDDTVLINFLAARYGNEYNTMFSELISISFQRWKIASLDPKSAGRQQLYRIFIQSKLPTVLSMILASSFGAFSAQEVVAELWRQEMTSSTDPEFISLATEFLKACSLHHLVSPESIPHLLNQEDLTTPTLKTLLTKDEVISQVLANHPRGVRMIDELSKGDANAGSMSQAVAEIINSYCHSKETEHLKDLANAIIRNPSVIDTIAMFVRPSHVVHPLCNLLDEWKTDDFHGESRPVYDEFGATLLLILVFKRRLGLNSPDLDIRQVDGFMSKYLATEGIAQNLNDASEETEQHLGEWINAFYVSGVLNDELTSHCSPQQFYLLIPTLLKQSVLALQNGALTQESLKSGLEFLLDPFILPSLVSGISWAVNMVPQDLSSASEVLKVLVETPENDEAKEVHSTILSMLSPEVRRCLGPSSSDAAVIPILAAFKEDESSYRESDEIASVSAVSSTKQLKQFLIDLIHSNDTSQSSSNTSSQQIPSLLTKAERTEGSILTLQTLVDTMLEFSNRADFVFALDTIATLISLSPTLRNVLSIKYLRIADLLKREANIEAEALVHLHRRAEAYAAVLTVQETNLDQFHQLENMEGVTNSENAIANGLPGGAEDQSDVVGTGATGRQQDQLITGTDGGDDIDQVLDEAAALGNLEQQQAVAVAAAVAAGVNVGVQPDQSSFGVQQAGQQVLNPNGGVDGSGVTDLNLDDLYGLSSGARDAGGMGGMDDMVDMSDMDLGGLDNLDNLDNLDLDLTMFE